MLDEARTHENRTVLIILIVQFNSPDVEKENDTVQVNLAYKYYIERQQHPRPHLGQ